MIYCGYQGTGKSTYCKKNRLRAVDLDSSLFTKEDENWVKKYVDLAQEISDAGVTDVFISAHKEVINYLIDKMIPFTVIAPKHEYIIWQARLEFRYYSTPTLPNLKALKDFKTNFKEDMDYYRDIEKLGYKVIWVSANKITTNLEDFIE